jgi:hypothetical protein
MEKIKPVWVGPQWPPSKLSGKRKETDHGGMEMQKVRIHERGAVQTAEMSPVSGERGV